MKLHLLDSSFDIFIRALSIALVISSLNNQHTATQPHSHPNHHTGPSRLRSPFWCCVLCGVEAADLRGGWWRTSATKRRRERRLRSWWRHECQSVRMALTAGAHHSAEKVAAGGTNSGLRAQTTVSAGRLGVLEEPEPPLLCERAACPRSLGAPQLAAAASGAPIPHCRFFEAEERGGGRGEHAEAEGRGALGEAGGV